MNTRRYTQYMRNSGYKRSDFEQDVSALVPLLEVAAALVLLLGAFAVWAGAAC